MAPTPASPASTDSRRPLAQRELAAWRGFLRTHKELVSRLDAELVETHGLQITAYEVLMYLGDAGGSLRMSALADRLLLSRSGLTRLVDRLERDGLVVRRACADDRRGLEACLTDAGRARLSAARRDHLAGVRRHFLSRLDRDQLALLAEAWESLLPELSSGVDSTGARASGTGRP